MKKLALAAVAAAAMMAGGAQAYTSGTFSNGVVVPNVIHNGSNLFTGVGLISQSSFTVGVFWTFFDQNSGHVTDGCFPMTRKDYQPFVWNDATAGLGLADKRGYLVFAGGVNGATTTPANACAAANSAGIGGGVQLAAHAFTVDTAAHDVAYLPVIDGDLTIAGDLSTMGPNSLTNVTGAAQHAAAVVGDLTFNMRYFLDAGATTNIVVWSTGNQQGTHTVNMYDDKQERKSVNFKLDHSELDWFDPATIPGRPAAFVDGYIEWTVDSIPTGFAGTPGSSFFTVGGSAFSYSVMNAPAFGATQSVLGFHY